MWHACLHYQTDYFTIKQRKRLPIGFVPNENEKMERFKDLRLFETTMVNSPLLKCEEVFTMAENAHIKQNKRFNL